MSGLYLISWVLTRSQVGLLGRSVSFKWWRSWKRPWRTRWKKASLEGRGKVTWDEKKQVKVGEGERYGGKDAKDEEMAFFQKMRMFLLLLRRQWGHLHRNDACDACSGCGGVPLRCYWYSHTRWQGCHEVKFSWCQVDMFFSIDWHLFHAVFSMKGWKTTPKKLHFFAVWTQGDVQICHSATLVDRTGKAPAQLTASTNMSPWWVSIFSWVSLLSSFFVYTVSLSLSVCTRIIGCMYTFLCKYTHIISLSNYISMECVCVYIYIPVLMYAHSIIIIYIYNYLS